MSETRNVVAICTDQRYFLPSAFLAERLAVAADRGGYDVALIHEGVSAGDLARLAARTQGRVATIPFAADQSRLPTTRWLSRAAYMRLHLDALLPDRYRRILYLDADIHVHSDELPLLFDIRLEVPFAAARDGHYAILDCPEATGGLLHTIRGPAELQSYRAALGLGPDDAYLNSGVMLFDRDRWAESGIAAETLAFAAAYPERCLFADQSALNAVVRGRWGELSPRWNYQPTHIAAGLRREISPVLRHFAGPHKPWSSDIWGARYREEYERWRLEAGWPTGFDGAAPGPPPVERRGWLARLTGARRPAAATTAAPEVPPDHRRALRDAVRRATAPARFVDLDPGAQQALLAAIDAGR